MKTQFLFFVVSVMTTVMSKAQNADTTKMVFHRPFQCSFVSPMGTNGMESGKYTNNFSINILAGYAGGLNGLELGGFANLILHDLKGTQIAGFSNTVLGETKGCQLSGFSNVSKKNLSGTQIAGFSNVIVDSAKAIQISGFTNVVKGSIQGAQLAGFTNYAHHDSKAIQLAGFSNVTKGSLDGVQLSGFSNVAANDSKIIQLSGFANTTKGNVEGAQIAGFCNIASNSLTGVQMSGFLNVAKKVKGSQIGFINVCDSIEEGVAIGFLSFVRKGYRAFEIGMDETLYAQASFKMGTEKFYNILSVGMQQKRNTLRWGWGYGVGTIMEVSQRMNVNVDLMSYHINEDQWWTNKLNILNKLKANVSYHFSDQLAIYGGLSYNVYVTDRFDYEGVEVKPSLAPWTSYHKTKVSSFVQMYPGFNAGIRF